MIYDASSIYSSLRARKLVHLNSEKTLDLAFYEVGNGLVSEMRRSALSREAVKSAIRLLAAVDGLMDVKHFVELDPEKVLELSKSTGLTFYDAAYLALALTLREPLVTEDKALMQHARRLGLSSETVKRT